MSLKAKLPNPFKAKKARAPKFTSGVTFIQRSRSVSPAEKAVYHELEGAGRSHVRRRFFGMSKEDEAVITDLVERDIERRLKAS